MRRKILCVLVPFALALALRLYPTLISGLPFSTDAWAPIRNAELLIEHAPVNIGDDNVFDGYNNYWPANSLFGAVTSLLIGLSPMRAMSFYLPAAGAITILIFYTLVRGQFNHETALFASLIFGTAFTHVYLTAGVTKETFANPLYLSIILIFLNEKLSRTKSTIPAFTLFSVALAMAHHLTSVIAITVLLGITLAKIIAYLKTGGTLGRFHVQLTLILTATVLIYFGVYAHKGFLFAITTSDVLSAASYQIIAFAAAAYITFKPYTFTKNKILVSTLATAALALLFIIITTNITLVPGFTLAVQKHVLPYISSCFVIMPFITLGYVHQGRRKDFPAPVFWLAALTGLQAYSIFSNPSQNVGLLIRTPNFLYAPMAILSASGLQYLIIKTGGKRIFKILGKLTVTATIAAIIIMNLYSLYTAAALQDRYLGYHWLYKNQEYRAGIWINAAGAPKVTGDMKVLHLMRDYFHLSVDVLGGYRYLTENSQPKPQLLFIYSQMLRNGYILGLHGVDLPENWMEKTYSLNHIYSNRLADLYAG